MFKAVNLSPLLFIGPFVLTNLKFVLLPPMDQFGFTFFYTFRRFFVEQNCFFCGPALGVNTGYNDFRMIRALGNLDPATDFDFFPWLGSLPVQMYLATAN